MSNKQSILNSVLITFSLAFGILFGYYFLAAKPQFKDDLSKEWNKVAEVIRLIEEQYVDEVDPNELTESTIKKILEKLDPHSAYIPIEEKEMSETSYESNYEGIGVEFNIFNDTLFVISPLSGGPSAKLGILPGDMILEIDGENVAGIGLTNKMVFDKLRGEKGSEVNISIRRKGYQDLLEYSIIRDKIPSFTVDAAYMIDDSTGYIRLSRFSQNSAAEVHKGLDSLIAQGMKNLIFDLRYNSGGILSSALLILDDFLEEGKLLLYTKGKDPSSQFEYYSRFDGLFEEGNLLVLINEGSASASEILAGTLQDHDRAKVVGRRSFGKGLVQSSFDLKDSSEFRMTISRYYIPSGRSIQKDYKNGNRAYSMELIERIERGELYNEDSVAFIDSLEYQTASGRKVYGGGGITPDYFIPRDTSYMTGFYISLNSKSVLTEFAFDYANSSRDKLEKGGFDNFYKNYQIPNKVIEDLKSLAETKGIEINEKELSISMHMIKAQLKALIARNIWGENAFFQVYNNHDEMYPEALKLIRNGEE